MDKIAEGTSAKDLPLEVVEIIPETAETGYAYFWEKDASSPDAGKHDSPIAYRIEDDETLDRLIRNLRNRTLGKNIPFDSITPMDTSVIKWVNSIRDDFPKLYPDAIDNLLTSFRGALQTSSKKRGKFIVGILLRNQQLLLVHSRIDPGLFKGRDGKKEMYTADLVLHTNNVIRADLIDFSNEMCNLSAYEYDRKYSKGHAKFWGIKTRDIRWETSSSIRFILRLDDSEKELIRPATFEEVSSMLESGEITPTGEACIGDQEAIVSRVEVGRSNHTFDEFYQKYIMITEDIALHTELFHDIINPNNIMAYDESRGGKFDYEEDVGMLYECAEPEHRDLKRKNHHNFTLCYFTEAYPGIRPLPLLTSLFYRALFQNKRAEVLHVGEPLSTSPLTIGKLDIFNEINIDEDSLNFVEELINKINDYSSKKGKAVLSGVVTRYLRNCIGNIHLPTVFDFIFQEYIVPKMNGEFSKKGLIIKESEIEFKSKDSFSGKTGKFVSKTLVPTIRKYVSGPQTSRLCIIYGIEDDGTVNPISNLPSDRVNAIEVSANEELAGDLFKIEAHAIKDSGGSLLLIIILPK